MTRLVVVGAGGAGMSAAHQALRTARARGRELQVTVLDGGRHTSYSACGIPYWVAGDVPDGGALVARTAEEHRRAGIDLRLGVSAVELDPRERVVHTDDARALPFDHVVLATGAAPSLPPWALAADGRLVPGVLPTKTLDDGEIWTDVLTRGVPDRTGARRPVRRAVVVGGGYIGLEMAEALVRRGLPTTIVTRGRLMSTLEPELSERLSEQVTRAGVEVRCGDLVDDLRTDRAGRVCSVVSGRLEIAADVVALGTGVRPRTQLAVGAGLPVGGFGGLLPDERMRVADGVWAVGDCVESTTRPHGMRVFVPLGTHANKQGRVAGWNLAGGQARFGGVLGTAVTRFAAGGVHVEVARTGPSTAQLAAAEVPVLSLLTESTTASGYMPEARPIAVTVLAESAGPNPGRLVGVQIIGGEGSGKRIDTAAAAIWMGASVDDVAGMDLSYAPPFSPVWDPVQISCRRLAERLPWSGSTTPGQHQR